MPNKLNLTGKIFGRLTFIKEVKQRKNGNVQWLCRCECGKMRRVRTDSLTSSNTRSCGCYKRDRTSEIRRKHGESGNKKSRLYKIWAGVLVRCSHKKFKNYGGRGITGCPEWSDYMVFRDWALVHDYREDLEIDRIDNDGDYCPENCRWVTRKVNSRNTRRTRWETIDGVTKSLADWCDIYNMSYAVVYRRLVSGWELLDALKRPVQKCVRTKLPPNG